MAGDSARSDKLVVLPVRCRRVALTGGESVDSHTVHCPVVGEAKSLEHCQACPSLVQHLEGPPEEALTCRVPDDTRLETGTVDELLGPDSLCLDGDLPVGEALALLATRGLTAAPVVDDRGTFVGCARISSLRRLHEEDVALAQRHLDVAPQVVDDALVPAVAVVRPDAPLAEAARLMARHRLHQLPVVSADGQVVGVLTPMDLVRWLAEQAGVALSRP